MIVTKRFAKERIKSLSLKIKLSDSEVYELECLVELFCTDEATLYELRRQL